MKPAVLLETLKKCDKKNTNTLQQLTFIFTIISTLALIFCKGIDIKYKSMCELFYGIPQRYFSKELSIDWFLPLIFLIPILSCLAYICYDLFKDIVIATCITTFPLGMLVVCIKLLRLICKTFNLKPSENFKVAFLLIISIVGFIITILLFKLIKTHNNTKKFIAIFIAVVNIIECILFIESLYNPEYNRNYEFLSNSENKYVILTEYDDKFLIVPYEEYEDTYIFKTAEYQFINKTGVSLSYKKIKGIPKIIN